MAVLLAFVFISGVITIFSPCILPLLPTVLAGGSSGGKARPFGVIFGFDAKVVYLVAEPDGAHTLRLDVKGKLRLFSFTYDDSRLWATAHKGAGGTAWQSE
jgi:hypothetical protein